MCCYAKIHHWTSFQVTVQWLYMLKESWLHHCNHLFVVTKHKCFQNGTRNHGHCCITFPLKEPSHLSFIKWQIEFMFASFPCHFLSFLIIRNVSAYNHNIKLIFCWLHVFCFFIRPSSSLTWCCNYSLLLNVDANENQSVIKVSFWTLGASAFQTGRKLQGIPIWIKRDDA